MTSATTQQICVAAFHSYSRPLPNAHNIIANSSVPNQENEIHGTSLIVVPISKAYVKDSMFGLWKEGAGLFQLFQIQVNESLNLTDAQSKKVFKTVSETLDLADVVTKFKKVIRSVNETLNLTDTQQKLVRKFASDTLNIVDTQKKLVKKAISETLGLTDTTKKLVKKTVLETLGLTDTTQKLIRRTVLESLALTDTNLKKGSKFVQEVLSLIDDASRVFIPGGGGQLFQRAVNETLDLIDSVLVNVFRVPPPAIPGGGHIIPTRIREQIPSTFKRPNFVYKITIEETLNLKDKVSSIATHYNLIPRMFYGSEVKEYLTMLDKVTIKVIRSGRKNILERIKSALNYLDILDLGATEDSPLAIAADVSRINVHLTKTNRGARLIQEQLQIDLKKIINKMLRDYKQAGGFIDSETIKQKYEDEVTALIRVAVQQSYIMGVNYVGKALKVKSLYLTGTDIERIKSETERITAVFFRNAQEYLKQWQMTERMKLMPIGFGGLFGDIAKSLEGIVKVISSIATFSIANKATTSKLSQIPKTATVDPITSVATITKRILVFVTKKDEKVCPICQRYEGVEYEEDDPFIVNPVDDTHPNCRCRLLIKTEMDSDVLTG
ncbi:MAG TPA: phage minor head protein [Nitrososphaeraceae archaeon]|nr:phage minor head protein [Nitrososphaeraceae archaeon]